MIIASVRSCVTRSGLGSDSWIAEALDSASPYKRLGIKPRAYGGNHRSQRSTRVVMVGKFE